jgi:hypothetical protein
VTALSAKELIPGPEMISMAFSITETAMANAQPEFRKALKGLKEEIVRFRRMFAEARVSINDAELKNPDKFPSSGDVRDAMATLLYMEQNSIRLSGMLRSVIVRKNMRVRLGRPGLPLTYRDLVEFSKELNKEWLPFVRNARLTMICGVASRARENGVVVIDLTSEFRDAFMRASIEETEGWQETAYFLADVEDAKLLDQSIRSIAHDHTDDLFADR